MSVSIGVTGHRKFTSVDHALAAKGWLEGVFTITGEHYNGIDVVNVGGAYGTDLMAAEIADEMGFKVKLWLPYEGYTDKWYQSTLKRLHRLMDKHEYVYVSEPGYKPWKYTARDKKIVAASWMMLAILSTQDSGTGRCVQIAKTMDKHVIAFNPVTGKVDTFVGALELPLAG